LQIILPVITAIVVAYIGYLGIKYQADTAAKESTSEASAGEATIKFVVLDKATGDNITGATITLQIDVMPSETNVTDTDGVARFFLKPEFIGLHGFLRIEADGYISQKRDIDIDEKKPYVIYLEAETSATVSEIPTEISSAVNPKIYDFQTCTSLCTGQNNSMSFSEGIKKIYAQFNYENFPSGAKYVRTWSLNGMEWIRYSCNWDGPKTGTEVLTLKEPQGLRSGTWEITIMVNNEVVLRDQITVNGNWNYWDPAGTINACHGTVD